MFVITADQVRSRSHADLAGSTRDSLNQKYGGNLTLPVDRNAGDEIQALTGDADTTLSIVLELTRAAQWSVGLGCGTVRLPLPAATREASGDAFFAAREAVNRAKKTPTKFAIETPEDPRRPSAWPTSEHVEAVVNLLLLLRSRRSQAGWELYDLTVAGLPQNAAAARLGITPPAASSRARAAGIKAEAASVPALARLLEDLDRSTGGTDMRA